jgi:hypothetical protein
VHLNGSTPLHSFTGVGNQRSRIALAINPYQSAPLAGAAAAAPLRRFSAPEILTVQFRFRSTQHSSLVIFIVARIF